MFSTAISAFLTMDAYSEIGLFKYFSAIDLARISCVFLLVGGETEDLDEVGGGGGLFFS